MTTHPAPTQNDRDPRPAAPRNEHPPAWSAMARRRPVLSFVALAVGLSWLVWIPGLTLAPDALGLVYAGAFGPAIAGALMVRAHGRRLRDWLRGMARWRVPLRWYAVAFAVPLLEPATATMVLARAGLPVTPELLAARLPIFVVGFGMTLLLGGGQEEPGWRGWLLPRLQERGLDPLAASILIGMVWAVWHLPMFFFGIYEGQSFPLYLALVTAFSVIFTWLYNATGGSVLLAMLLHAKINTAPTWMPFTDEHLVEAMQEHMLAVQAAVTAVFVAIAALLVARVGTRLGADRGDATTSTARD